MARLGASPLTSGGREQVRLAGRLRDAAQAVLARPVGQSHRAQCRLQAHGVVLAPA